MSTSKKANGNNGSESIASFAVTLRAMVTAIIPFAVLMYFIVGLTVKSAISDLAYSAAKTYATIEHTVSKESYEPRSAATEQRISDLKSQIEALDRKLSDHIVTSRPTK